MSKQKELHGALFIAKEGKRDYEGVCTINDQEYWVSGWKKPTKDGGVWLSLAFEKKEPREDMSDRPF